MNMQIAFNIVYIIVLIGLVLSGRSAVENYAKEFMRQHERSETFRRALANVSNSKSLTEAVTIARAALSSPDLDENGKPTGGTIYPL